MPGAWAVAYGAGPRGDVSAYRKVGSVDLEPGQTLERVHVTGRVRMAPGSTLRDFVIVNNGHLYAIDGGATHDGRAKGCLVEHGRVTGTNHKAPTHSAAILGHDFAESTFRYLDVTGHVDHAKFRGGNNVISDSHLHGVYRYEGSHADGVQCASPGGTGLTISRCVIDGLSGDHPGSASGPGVASGMAVIQAGGKDWLIEDSLLIGGSYSWQIGGKDGDTSTATARNVGILTTGTLGVGMYRYGPLQLRAECRRFTNEGVYEVDGSGKVGRVISDAR